jgi:hypothetical protein
MSKFAGVIIGALKRLLPAIFLKSVLGTSQCELSEMYGPPQDCNGKAF